MAHGDSSSKARIQKQLQRSQVSSGSTARGDCAPGGHLSVPVDILGCGNGWGCGGAVGI